eukprot:1543201-Amphidinium_carterae.1
MFGIASVVISVAIVEVLPCPTADAEHGLESGKIEVLGSHGTVTAAKFGTNSLHSLTREGYHESKL